MSDATVIKIIGLPDGMPNRPLTAFTIEFLSLEKAEAESP